MKFNKFYNSLDNDQRKEVNKYIKGQVREERLNAQIARVFNVFLVGSIIAFILNPNSIIYRSSK